MPSQSFDIVKICPKCNTSFVCNTKKCWCQELPQIIPVNHNEECLCPQCLIDLIVEKLEPKSKTE